MSFIQPAGQFDGIDCLDDLKQLRGKVVLVYFWSSTSPRAAEGFDALKPLTDRYQYRGLQVVYVNVGEDRKPAPIRRAG